MSPMHQTTEDPRQGSPLSARMEGDAEKDWPKRPSDRQLQRGSKKDSDRAITPVAEAVRVPTGQAAASPSHWGRAATGKKSLVSMCAGSLWLCPTLCDPVVCGLPGSLSGKGVLQARILEHIGQYRLPYPLEHSISCCPSHQLP